MLNGLCALISVARRRERTGGGGALRFLQVGLHLWVRELRRMVCGLYEDEIDALVGDTLLAVLRQLRAGYPERPSRFPQSVVLCGVRGRLGRWAS